ncbi:MAG: hypothetical protein HZB91_06690 [Elusimicrobia bacterium]|nr:hypothetical protein [Elusimicrobiota bacterium]
MRACILGAGFLMALLAGPAPAASSTKGKPKADPETVRLVELFLKTPVQDLPPESVPYFLEVATAALPGRLLHLFLAKRIELLALKRLSESKNKGSLKRPTQEPQTTCSDPDVLTPQAFSFLKKMGFNEYKDVEVAFLMKETNCTMCELRSEFTLTVVQIPGKDKKKKDPVRFLFRDDDPIIALLAHYYSGTTNRNTSFFGIGASPKCRY